MIRRATIAKNSKNEIVIRLDFSRDDLTVLYAVRKIVGRQYHSEEDCWSIPFHTGILTELIALKFSIQKSLRDYLEREKDKVNILKKKGIPGFRGELYQFQSEGVSFFEQHNGNAINADEMGLGKTIQTLAWLQLHPELRPAIIVVPASLKLNWAREAEKWMDHPRISILSGTSVKRPKGDIIIVNYDILYAWVDCLLSMYPKVLVTDECHYYKTNRAKRTKAIKKLGKRIDHIIPLSGTPIENRPIEIYNAWKLVDPTNCPNYRSFIKTFCAAKHTGFGWNVSGASNEMELHRLLTSSVMIRRLKADVLKELPDKIYSFVPMRLKNRPEYIEAEHDFIAFLRKYKGAEAAERAESAEALVAIEGLKQLAVDGKLSACIEWIHDFLEINDKLVVFATHKSIIEALMKEFGKVAVKIDGSVSTAARQKAVDAFQTDPNIHLFVGNIRAAGVGITLTASSNVAFLELPWTPGALNQAIDRCHRIGQRDCVNVYFLLAAHTIEERIAKLLDDKRKILDAVLDGTVTSTKSLLSILIKEYVNK